MKKDAKFLWYLFVEIVLVFCACWLVFVSEEYIQALLIFIIIELRQISFQIKTP